MKFALGTVQFGLDYGVSNNSGQTSQQEVQAILKKAKENSLLILDTARVYGESEEVLGRCESISDFNIVSKFMPSHSDGPISDQLKSSLEKLRVSKLYGFLTHRPNSLIDYPEDWQELIQLKKEGLVEKIGFSLNTPHELESLLENGLEPDLIQVPYNYLDRRFEDHMIRLHQKGCEIHARSSFLQGLFFVPAENLTEHFDEIIPLLSKLQSKYGKSLASSLLHFTTSRPFIDKVVIGVENSTQLSQNIEQLETAIPLENRNFMISERILVPSNWPEKKTK